MVVQPGLCGAWSETPKAGFLTTRLIAVMISGAVSFMFSLTPDNDNNDKTCREKRQHYSLFNYYIICRQALQSTVALPTALPKLPQSASGFYTTDGPERRTAT